MGRRADDAPRHAPELIKPDLRREGDIGGFLDGEKVVFTGTLSAPRTDLAVLAEEAGCEVQSAVTRKTTLLAVGMQDGNVVGDTGKSSKHRKAEQLVRDGAELRIVTEEDFRLICGAPPIAWRSFLAYRFP